MPVVVPDCESSKVLEVLILIPKFGLKVLGVSILMPVVTLDPDSSKVLEVSILIPKLGSKVLEAEHCGWLIAPSTRFKSILDLLFVFSTSFNYGKTRIFSSQLFLGKLCTE